MDDIRIRPRQIRNAGALAERLNEVLGSVDRRVDGVEDLPAAMARFNEELERFRSSVPTADAFERSLAAIEDIRAIVVARSAELVGAVDRAENAANIVEAIAASKQGRAERGQPNGYAPLDEFGRLAKALFPTLTVADIEALADALAELQPLSPELTALAGIATQSFGRGMLEKTSGGAVRDYIGAIAAASPALTGVPTAPTPAAGTTTTQIATAAFVASALLAKLDAALVGVANGVAPLGADGKLPESVLPALAIVDTTTVASQAAMLALTAQKGDVAVRSDLNKSFILSASPATTLANWVELRTPTDAVLSVAGKTGAVALAVGDVGGLQTALDARQPLDADLTALAALTTQAFGRSVLEKANAADMRTLLGVTSAATQAFETGFWTPLVSFGTANNAFVPSYSLQLGRYMKFGSWVILGCRLQFSTNDYSASPPTGAFTITGLPFALKTLYPTTFRVTKASPPAGHLGAYLLTSGDGTTLTIRSFLGASGEATWAAAQIPASTTDVSFIFTLVLDLA